jgi:hypothetical protein
MRCATIVMSTTLAFAATSASAEWKVVQGAKVLPMGEKKLSTVVRTNALAPATGVRAYLQIDCFEHPSLTSRYFGVVTDKETAPGFLGWRYKFDDGLTVTELPGSRTSLSATGLGGSDKPIFQDLMKAKKMQLTLMPVNGPALTFDFDVTGAREAAAKIACKEVNKMR